MRSRFAQLSLPLFLHVGILLFVLVTGSPAGAANFRPVLEKTQGLPAGAHRFSDAAWNADGLVIASSNGLVCASSEGGWRLRAASQGTDLAVTVAVPGGFAVAGSGFCLVLRDGQWIDCKIADDFSSGVSCPEGALLAGRKAYYLVAPDGRTSTLLTFADTEAKRVVSINDTPVLFAGGNGIWSWRNGHLVDSAGEFSWVAGMRMDTVQQIADGTYVATTSRGFFLVKNGSREELIPERKAELYRNGVIGVQLFGETVVVETYYGGIQGFSRKEGTALWSFSTDEVGGNVNFAKPYGDGVLVGSSSALWVMPNPDRFSSTALPATELLFATKYSGGAALGTLAGVTALEGTAPVPPIPNIVSMLEYFPGKFAFGGFGVLAIDGETKEIPGREITRITSLEEGTWALLQPEGVSLLRKGEKPVRLSQAPTLGNSLVRLSDTSFILGSAEGAVVCNVTGTLAGRFGSGLTRVFDLGGTILVCDATGALFDGNGNRLGSSPFTEILDAVKTGPLAYLLGKTSDGQVRLVSMSTPQNLRVLDVPLPRLPQRLLQGDQGFYVVGVEAVYRFRDLASSSAPGAGLPPSLSNLQPNAHSISVPASSSTINLILPPARLLPWQTPTYAYRLGGAAWLPVPAGAAVAIQRLPYGENTIDVATDWGLSPETTSFTVRRAYPWWLKWWALAFYLAAAAAGVAMIVRLRTQRIARRARDLEIALDKRTEELKKALKAREEFFSTLSHEIRNPLNGVVGLCDMLDGADTGAVAPRERYLVRTLRGCAAQLRSTLDDVLDFSRIDRGDIQLHEDVFDLSADLEGACRSIDPKLETVTLTAPESAIWIRGDSGKIRQIICNLVSNALKYGEPKTARVAAECQKSGAAAVLRIAVRNTGPTIPAAEQESIFKGFSRGEDAMRKRIPGSGIGLAVSRRMARAMGGDIQLKSENGLTEFAFTLQLPIEPPPAKIASARGDAKKVARALAIEDEDYNRLVLGSLLKNLGYEVDWAVDGASALERAKTGVYDLVLTDFMLPDTTGAELAQRLLAVMKDPRPPIIAVTAYSTQEKIDQAKAAGISGFVSKPVDLRSLRAAIISAVPVAPLRHRFEVQEEGRWDFEPMLKMSDGKQFLAEYAASLPAAWATVEAQFADDGVPGKEARRTVHTFTSRVLAVYAEDIATQLNLLEDAAEHNQAPEAKKLLTVITPMIENLTRAAAAHALEY